MKTQKPSDQQHRFPYEIISHAVWVYHRFCLSFREVEELLTKRGVTVTYETVRKWCQKFGPAYARKLKKTTRAAGRYLAYRRSLYDHPRERHYLWRAVEQDGDTFDILVQRHRHKKAAERFFSRYLKSQGNDPGWLMTDKLRSHAAAHRTMMPTVNHLNHIYANNRAEGLHKPTRQQERAMRGFRSFDQAQRFPH